MRIRHSRILQRTGRFHNVLCVKKKREAYLSMKRLNLFETRCDHRNMRPCRHGRKRWQSRTNSRPECKNQTYGVFFSKLKSRMLRSLPFFTSSKTDPQFKIEPKAVANGGSLYLGDATGLIHKTGHDLSASLFSWPAFTHSITHLHFNKSKNILLSIGMDDTAPLLKSFNLGKMDKTQRPELLKAVKISTGNRPFPITVFAVSSSMAQIAIGFENGVVLLIRGDVSKDRSVSQKIIHEAGSPITGI
jgi:hypothetical protein